MSYIIIGMVLAAAGTYVINFKLGKNRNNMDGILTVTGKITAIYHHEIPSKVRGKSSKTETRIELKIHKAASAQRESIEPDELSYPIFGGDPSLLDRYSLGDVVRIRCTSATGRKIETITLVE